MHASLEDCTARPRATTWSSSGMYMCEHVHANVYVSNRVHKQPTPGFVNTRTERTHRYCLCLPVFFLMFSVLTFVLIVFAIPVFGIVVVFVLNCKTGCLCLHVFNF